MDYFVLFVLYYFVYQSENILICQFSFYSLILVFGDNQFSHFGELLLFYKIIISSQRIGGQGHTEEQFSGDVVGLLFLHILRDFVGDHQILTVLFENVLDLREVFHPSEGRIILRIYDCFGHKFVIPYIGGLPHHMETQLIIYFE